MSNERNESSQDIRKRTATSTRMVRAQQGTPVRQPQHSMQAQMNRERMERQRQINTERTARPVQAQPEREYRQKEQNIPVKTQYSLGKKSSNFLLIVAILVICVIAVIIYLTRSGKGSASAPVSHGVEIWEVMTSNKGTVPDEYGDFPDWIELHNTTSEKISISGFGLSDDALGMVKWAVPAGTEIEPDGYYVIFCSGDSDKGNNHANFRISASDVLTLSTESGTIIQQQQMQAVTAGMTYGKDENGNFTEMPPSPGFPNTPEGQQAFLETLTAVSNEDIGVYINEIQASNASTIVGPDGEYCDWIELYNTNTNEVDLSGYGISDSAQQPLKYVLPQGTKIPAQGVLLIFCSGREGADAGAVEAPFGLRAYGEEVVLATPKGKILDSTTYSRMETDTSLMRSPDGTGAWSITTQPTPGYPNTDAGLALFTAASPYGHGDIIISEVINANASTLRQPDMSYPDWIELYNTTGAPINLQGYALSKNAKNPAKWVFPDITLNAGEYMVVLATGKNVTDTQKKNLETNFSLSGEGDQVFLFSPEGKIMDKLVFGRAHTDVSYGRTGEQLLYYSPATPAAANGQGSQGYAEIPGISLPGGVYTSSQSVQISVPADSMVTYTLDGSEPKQTGTMYNGSITVASNTVLRARSFKDGMQPSDIATASYFILSDGQNTMESHETPFSIISLVTEPDNLFGTRNGIYVAGEDFAEKTGEEANSYTLEGDTSNVQWKLANFNAQHVTHPDPLGLEWQRPAHVEIIDTNGNLEYSDDLMVRIFGAYSRFKSQKGMSLVTKAGYGATSINDAIFDTRPYTSYQAITLRNSAMDCFMSKIRDILIQGLLEEAGTILPTQAYRRSIVYINGKYWGIYNMREKVNKYFLAQRYNISNPDTVEILVGNGVTPAAVINGENSYVAYKEMIDWVEAHDLSDPSNYAQLKTMMDVENFAEYCALEVFVGNTDTGNIKFWRSSSLDNKWRWIPYDFDWAFNRNDDKGEDTTSGYRRNFFQKYFHEKGHGVGKGFSTVLSRGLLKNSEFRALFLQKCAYMYKEVFTTEKLLDRINTLAAEMETEISFEAERWDGFSVKTWTNSIESLKDSAKNAPEYFIKYCQEYFNLSDADTTTLFGKVSSVG